MGLKQTTITFSSVVVCSLPYPVGSHSGLSATQYILIKTDSLGPMGIKETIHNWWKWELEEQNIEYTDELVLFL